MKSNRQLCIVDLIKSKDIENQEDLLKALENKGFDVKQSTISRDIKQLGLVKVLGANGKYKYALLNSSGEQAIANSSKYATILRESIITVDFAQNIVVIKTHSGMAQAAAVAIDGIKYPNMLGCIGGDDNIFIVVKNTVQAKELVGMLTKLVENE